MYGAKGSSLLNTVARQSGLSKQLAAAHSTPKSTAFLSNLQSRNVNFAYTTSRASAQLNKPSTAEDEQQQRHQQYRSVALHRTPANWQHLAKISRVPQARFNHALAAAQQQHKAEMEAVAAIEVSGSTTTPPSTATITDGSVVETDEGINRRILTAAKAKDPEAVVTEFLAGRTAGASMSTQTYDAVLDAYGTLRKHNHPLTAMLTVYEDMVANGVRPTSHTYATLIKCLCTRDDEVHKTVNMLRRRIARFGVEVSNLGELESENNLDRALALFERAVNEERTEAFDVELYNAMLSMLSTKGQTKDALYIYEQLELSKTVNPNSATFAMLMTLFGYAGDLSAVRECFNEYKALRGKLPKHDPAYVYNAYVYAHVEAGDLQGALDVLENVMTKDHVRVTIAPYNRIINGASTKNDLAFVDTLLTKLETESSLKPDGNTYGMLLSMYCRMKQADKADEMYNKMVQCDISRQYGHLADYVCLLRSQQRPDKSLEVVQLMSQKGFELDVSMAREVVMGYLDVKNTTKALDALKIVTSIHATSSFITERSPLLDVVREFTVKCNDLDSSVQAMRFMNKFGIKLDSRVAKAILVQYDAAKSSPAAWEAFTKDVDVRDFTTLYEAVFKSDIRTHAFSERVFELVETMRALSIEPTLNLYVRVSTRFKKHKDLESDARWKKVFEPYLEQLEQQKQQSSHNNNSKPPTTVQQQGSKKQQEMAAEVEGWTVESDLQSGAALDLAIQGNFKGSLEVLNKQIVQKGQIPSPDAVRDIIQQATRQNNLASAIKTYDLVIDPLMRLPKNLQHRALQHVYNSMLVAYARVDDLPNAREFYGKMRQRGMIPDGDAYGSLLSCTANTTADESMDALDIYDEAMKNKVRPTVYFYNVIMSKLAKCRKIDHVLRLFDEMKKFGVQPNSITYAALISACIRCSSEARAERFFHEMLRSPKYYPRIGVFNSMIQFYTQQKPNRDKALEYYHLLLQYNLKPSGHTYKLLMEVYANIPPYDMLAAHKLLTDMTKRHGIKPGPSHFATLIRSYGCLHRDVSSAVAVYNEMKKAKVKPDETVYQAMFNTYIDNNDMQAAEQLYKDMLTSGARSSPYIENLFITGYGARGDMEKAEKIWERMVDVKESKQSQVLAKEPSTYEAMVKAYLANEQPEKAFAVVQQMHNGRNFPIKVIEGVHALLPKA
ncbi:hypothetical protein BDA99DRAFT_522111 [Phascolomyces articulosus]|uniref:Pentacotripeptide-repeat region of PRORP domain-containing protein n=1 Tax=Phascolomyces articulosus TaxID=60185 RepID=A0AAD5K289_9FUNG|nr:hypothetical protein BDA99DRAFT_522111 [Phascolomyces articulosus]